MHKAEIIADGKLAYQDLKDMAEYFRDKGDLLTAGNCIENMNRVNNLLKLIAKLEKEK